MQSREAVEELLEQLEELLEEVGSLDEEDLDEPETYDTFLELAGVAGLLVRKGVDDELVDRAAEWRDGDGAELLREAWEAAELSDVEIALEEALDEDDEAVLAVLDDVDELVDGALWCGQTAALRPLLAQVAELLGDQGSALSGLAPTARKAIEEPFVLRHKALYAYWWVLAG
ncbi:MAG: hypothetical protein JXX28_02160 [Deltaproteobacteria bacterium]|nr:hypothetical protein [Deltaproteobacteria bacterium]